MNRARRRGAAAAGAVGTVSTAVLLRRMRRELLRAGRLTTSTVTWMYAAYGAHAAASAHVLRRSGGRKAPPRPLLWGGGAVALCGIGLFVAGAGRFAGPGQLSGTDPGTPVTGGIYRYTRNPQYTGYLLTLAGSALARRSPGAAALTVAAGAAYRWWIPVEEAHLEALFGSDYRHYRDRTARWLGRARITR